VYQKLGRLQFVFQELGSFELVFRNLEAQWNWSQKLRGLKISEAWNLYQKARNLGTQELVSEAWKLETGVSEAQKLGIGFQKLGTQHSARRE
jgi:hypothetical protein